MQVSRKIIRNLELGSICCLKHRVCGIFFILESLLCVLVTTCIRHSGVLGRILELTSDHFDLPIVYRKEKFVSGVKTSIPLDISLQIFLNMRFSEFIVLFKK